LVALLLVAVLGRKRAVVESSRLSVVIFGLVMVWIFRMGLLESMIM
jgi:hypothetical protein